MFAPQQAGQFIEKRTMPGDEPVTPLAENRETRQSQVQGEHPAHAGRKRERAKDGVGAAESLAVGQNKLHRLREALAVNIRKLVADLLKWRISHPVPREDSPAVVPETAKATLT